MIKDCSYSNRQYTLSNLKDLESKIILIRDSKSSTENGQSAESKSTENAQKARHNVLSSKEVDGFLDVRIYIHSNMTSIILMWVFTCIELRMIQVDVLPSKNLMLHKLIT